MTVRYLGSVATNSWFAFLKLLVRWRGSVYRYIWIEFLAFFGIYELIALTYRLAMPEYMKRSFETACIFCDHFGEYIPIPFVLGFFVDTIVGRWWNEFLTIPWPDELAMCLSAYTKGNSERVRMQRRTIMRYVNLSLVLGFRDISSKVRVRFPSEFTLISAGLMTQDELLLYYRSAPYNNVAHYMQPCLWVEEMLLKMREEGSIDSDRALEILFKKVTDYRSGLGTILCYDWIPLPLVYTQVATITVYSYAISSMFGWQFLEDKAQPVKWRSNLSVPFVGVLRFVFYMGWLKVAESLINPFGEDQDDYDIGEIIERNIHMSNYLVDSMYDKVPPMSRGVVLDVLDPPDDAEDNSGEEASDLDPLIGSQLYLGSVTNINFGGRIRRLTSIFGSRQLDS